MLKASQENLHTHTQEKLHFCNQCVVICKFNVLLANFIQTLPLTKYLNYNKKNLGNTSGGF